jgi:N-acetylglutamate synthase-like GNAT family acetyltransferase
MASIRPATEADKPTILKMVRDEQLDPTKLNWQNFLIAEVDGRTVGIGQIRQHADSRELGSLAVLPEYRKQGIAGQLIVALEARAGYPLYLFCRSTMGHYYAKFGFREIPRSEAPPALRRKALFPIIFRIFGIRIIIMRKDQPT